MSSSGDFFKFQKVFFTIATSSFQLKENPFVRKGHGF